ncbi:multidrug ABC transporter ATP-binding and permease protein [Secundilactobacillus pentosiphilus]|uniref:Multidrug ABC transporter ATP-binding and permease protein n=2 Tax=Secundilactobacillus pentosiphilus TaxID=1714682 RepID=A0A1Z5IVZ8_9LACO|nr:multidrug ABC transporter ATP-binding and permease protein [Secundilactobacillus pentosiphilus]
MKNNEHESAWAKSIPVKEQMGIVSRLIGYAKPYWRHFVVAIVLAALVSVVNILLPMILKDYMDNYLKVGRADLKIMWLFAGLYFFAMVTRAVMQFCQTYLYSMGAEYMLESVRRQLFEKLHHLGMRFYDQVPSGSILSRLTNDTMSFSTFWQLFSSLIVALFSVISSVIAMFLLDAQVAVWLLILLPFLGITIWYYQRYSSKVYRRMRERLSELNAKLSEAIIGISIIQQFRQEKRMNQEFDETNGAYFKSRQAMIRVNSLLLSPLIDLFYALGVIFVLTLLGVRGLNGFVPAGMIYAFVTYLDNLFNPMTSMMDNLSDFQEGIVSGSRVMKLMADKTSIPQQKPVAGREITTGKIEFKHVSFSYDGETPILDDISFVAQPGQTVALVGETGSGKSSIINVLMRFYDFQSGQVLIDDHDIREYDYTALRQKMGLVLQEPFLFYGTVASNIRMFDRSISDQQVRDAAAFVDADQMIESLPNGYDSKVIERGNGYSSGQKQLISFARTVVTDPKVLILDEATANIDTETEQEIQKSLAKLQSGRTTIAIAHRLSTIQNADLILVLHQGKIIERGTNDELMAKKGAYYDMIQLQNTAHLD